MSRVLLADDSPHAQRLGERLLREEGFEVVTVTDGQSALMRLADVDPDVVFADISLPRLSGYDICRKIKADPRHRHVRVVLTAGMLEHFDDGEAVASRCDAVLRKPFEASAVLSTIAPLIEAARQERPSSPPAPAPAELSEVSGTSSVPSLARTEVDAERIRAAVTVALDAAMPAIIDSITEKVLIALRD